jgi:hypothetical protein
VRDFNAPPESQPGAKMGDRDRERLGRSVGGLVKNDKVRDPASEYAFALAALLFSNARDSPLSFVGLAAGPR